MSPILKGKNTAVRTRQTNEEKLPKDSGFPTNSVAAMFEPDPGN